MLRPIPPKPCRETCAARPLFSPKKITVPVEPSGAGERLECACGADMLQTADQDHLAGNGISRTPLLGCRTRDLTGSLWRRRTRECLLCRAAVSRCTDSLFTPIAAPGLRPRCDTDKKNSASCAASAIRSVSRRLAQIGSPVQLNCSSNKHSCPTRLLKACVRFIMIVTRAHLGTTAG